MTTMNYLELEWTGRNTPLKVKYSPVPNGNSIGACCGSDWYASKPRKVAHTGIIVSTEGVNVSTRVAKDKLKTDTIVTKNGTFNINIRTQK